MTLETWLAFAAASFAVLAIPGPTVMLVVGYALGEGRRAALGTVAGVLLGDLLAISVSALGLGALLAASAEVFTVFKWRERPTWSGSASRCGGRRSTPRPSSGPRRRMATDGRSTASW